MNNGEMMTLTLSRLEVLDVRMATLQIILESKEEYENPETTTGRKEVLEGTIRKWTRLRNEIIRQFDKQDEQ